MNRAKWITIIFATMLLAAPACKKGVNTASDPIKKQAEEHYTNARRLFLTCDPDKYTDAIKEYQLALNLWDEYPEALAGVAEAISMWRGYSMTEQEFGEAYKYAQRALRLNPELPRAIARWPTFPATATITSAHFGRSIWRSRSNRTTPKICM